MDQMKEEKEQLEQELQAIKTVSSRRDADRKTEVITSSLISFQLRLLLNCYGISHVAGPVQKTIPIRSKALKFDRFIIVFLNFHTRLKDTLYWTRRR